MSRLATHLSGTFSIDPLCHGDFGEDCPDALRGTPWRWLAVVQWVEPGMEIAFPHFICRRSLCPLRLARWVYLVAARVAARVAEKQRGAA